MDSETVITENGEFLELQVMNMKGDGSCLFRSLSYLLHKTQKSHLKLRLQLVNYVISKWEYFQPRTIADDKFTSFTDSQAYKTKMCQEFTYGSACEVEAASLYFKCRFEIFKDGQAVAIFDGSANGSAAPKRLRFSEFTAGQGHYDVYLNVSRRGRPKKIKKGRPVSLLSKQERDREKFKKYNQNHPEVHRNAAAKYQKTHPEVNRKSVKLYTKKNEEVKKKKHEKYLKEHPEKNRAAVRRYIETSPEKRRASVRQYIEKNPEKHRAAVRRYVDTNPEKHRISNRAAVCKYITPEKRRAAFRRYLKKNREKHREACRQYYENHKERFRKSSSSLLSTKQSLLSCAKKIITKYNDLKKKIIKNKRQKTFKKMKKLHLAHALKQKLLKLLKYKTHGKNNIIEVQKTIKWSLHIRSSAVKSFCFFSKKIKEMSSLFLLKFPEIEISSGPFENFQYILAPSLHLPSQEPYFSDDCYKTVPNNYVIAMNSLGEASNIVHPPINISKRYTDKTIWVCSETVCDFQPTQLSALQKCLIFFAQTPPRKLFLLDMKNELHFLNTIKPHFPRIRTFLRQLYLLIQKKHCIQKIDDAISAGDLATLEVLTTETKSHFSKKVPEEARKPEDQIIDEFQNAFQLLAKKSSDTPTNDCRSCQRLLCRRDVTIINNMRKPFTSECWAQLNDFLDQNNVPKSQFICNYCVQHFRKNTLPPISILNSMFTTPQPKEISDLNEFEKILIQRAKAFQVVVNMQPIANKSLPNRQMVKKMKGRTFHLPLPINETLATLPKPEDPLNRDSQIHVIVRSAPTKKKIIWEDVVSIKKVYSALEYLKINNELYRNIRLPDHPEDLLFEIDENFEHEITEDTESQPPLLKKIDTAEAEAEDYHNQFTIYPLHENRENIKISALYQMTKIEAPALNTTDRQLDVKCFPDLYPEGKFGQFYKREIKVNSAEFIKAKLMSKYCQFRLNQQYLFYLLNDTNIRQLSAGIFFQMNTSNIKFKLSAKQYLDSLSKGELETDLKAIFSRLRNTEQYWSKPRNDVQCMTQYYGPATWFLTISPSEWCWDDLGEYIRTVNGSVMEKRTTSELVALDPVSASRFIENKFKAILDFLLSEDEPLGKIEHYFYRREYQARGAQHFHLILWVKNAPVLGQSTPEEVCHFIQKYVTCAIPDKNASPTLYERVTKFQSHRHNDYCLRTKKTKNGFKKVCRFSFPRPESDSITLRDLAESIAHRKTLSSNGRLYNLPRTSEETFINDYNPAVLLAWNGNMDIQFVGEKSTLLNFYLTKYSTKSEKSHAADVFHDINSTKSLSSRLYNVGLRALSHRECGALEAADTLLSIPLYGTDGDTTIRWLDVSITRNKRLKPRKELESLPPESTDIFYQHFIDDYYPRRPEELENLSLFDFAGRYDIVNAAPKTENNNLNVFPLSEHKFLKERKRPHLVNHYRFNPDQYPEEFFHSLLLLFKPWRKTEELLNGENTYAESFIKSKEQLEEAVKYAELQTCMRERIEKTFEMIEKKIQELESDETEDDGPDNPLEFQATEAENAMEDLRHENTAEKEENLEEMMSNLNADQKRVIDYVIEGLSGSKGENFVLRHFVSGTGGTGKSYLIKTIKTWTNKNLGKNVAVSAPTGVAAFNVNGLTTHRLFQLPVEHGQTPKFKYLSDHVLQTLRNELQNVALFIIDEISMVSNLTLLYINLRLSEIFGTTDHPDGWFGRKHILLTGDLLQLPPIHEQPPYEMVPQAMLRKNVGGISAVNIWQRILTYDELTINMRQSADRSFGEALERIRLGHLTNQDFQMLSNRLLPISSVTIPGRLSEITTMLAKLPPDTVCLLPKRNMCSVLNTAMLQMLPTPEINIAAVDSIDCPNYLKKKVQAAIVKLNEDASQTAGLEHTLTLKIGCKIMLRRNIDVTLGLVNGSIGEVVSFKRNLDNPDFPKSIKIRFSHGLEHDLEPVQTKFQIITKAYVHRTQYPLSVAYAITIHKSQGLSLNNVLLDIGRNVFTRGQAYVALSRAITLQGLHLINFDPSEIKSLESAKMEYNRLRTKYRPDLPNIFSNTTKETVPRRVPDRQWIMHHEMQDAVENNSEDKKSIRDKHKLTLIRGFVCTNNNSDLHSFMICLLYCETIRDTFKKSLSNELKTLVNNFEKCEKPIDFTIFFSSLSVDFQNLPTDNPQNNCLLLLDSLFTIAPGLEQKLSLKFEKKNYCKECQSIESETIVKVMLNALCNEKDNTTTMPEIVKHTLKKPVQERKQNYCSHCAKHTNTNSTITLKDIGELLILTLDKITEIKINGLSNCVLRLLDKKYSPHAALYWKDTKTPSFAAFISVSGSWVQIDEIKVEKKPWPRGSKNIQIIIFQSL